MWRTTTRAPGPMTVKSGPRLMSDAFSIITSKPSPPTASAACSKYPFSLWINKRWWWIGSWLTKRRRVSDREERPTFRKLGSESVWSDRRWVDSSVEKGRKMLSGVHTYDWIPDALHCFSPVPFPGVIRLFRRRSYLTSMGHKRYKT